MIKRGTLLGTNIGNLDCEFNRTYAFWESSAWMRGGDRDGDNGGGGGGDNSK